MSTDSYAISEYNSRKAYSDDVDAVKRTGNRLIKRDAESRHGVDDLLDPATMATHGLSHFQKAHVGQLELEHAVNGNHNPSIGIAYNGRPHCTKCDVFGTENPHAEGDLFGTASVAQVREIPRNCGTCGHKIHMDDPIAGTYKHDPGYEGRARDFNMTKAHELDAHHSATMPLPPKG